MSGGLTYRFIPPRLKDLDAEQGHLLVVSLFDDDRPPGGLTGLVDWRMDGLLSRIRATTIYPNLDNPLFSSMATGPFDAGENENLLFPAGRHLPFEMVLVIGLGSSQNYTGQRYRAVVTHLLESLASLKTRSVALQLPGWQAAGLPARRACDIFVTELLSMKRRKLPVPMDVCFIEALEHQAEMDERIVELLEPNPRR